MDTRRRDHQTPRRVPRWPRAAVGGVVALLLVAAAPSQSPAPGTARAVVHPFVVSETSPRIYAVRPPSADPQRQVVRLTADDSTELYLEVWLPERRNGPRPPDRLPTVLLPTPYHAAGQAAASTELLEPLVERGYAYARLHLRGTGSSSGCIGILDTREAHDVSLAIEYLAHRAPWSNGRVGLTGLSWQGGAALNAVLRGTAAARGAVDAIEVAAPALSVYEMMAAQDGVPQLVTGQTLAATATVAGTANAAAGQTLGPALIQRASCLPSHTAASVALADGSQSAYVRERDMRPSVEALDVPLLLFHGHEDYDPFGVLPIVQAGFFDRIPEHVPHVGIFGVWQHEYPVENGGPYSDRRLDIRRADSDELRVAWFDHFLRDIDAGVDRWPQIQVQSTDGLWRVMDRWPTPSGTPAHLTLGDGRALGTVRPQGHTTYLEGNANLKAADIPGTRAVFTTPPLPGRLELAGIPTADLWVQLQRSDAHVVVTLEALDADGTPVPGARTYGSRSAQHLDPFDHGRFTQEQGRPAPVGVPLRVPVRLNPVDLAVPAGGRLRLTVTGMANTTEGIESFGRFVPVVPPDPLVGQGTQPSGVAQVVRILHDCDHTSALRFNLPDSHDYLSVRRLHPDDATRTLPPRRTRITRPEVDGGGLAVADTCGGTT